MSQCILLAVMIVVPCTVQLHDWLNYYHYIVSDLCCDYSIHCLNSRVLGGIFYSSTATHLINNNKCQSTLRLIRQVWLRWTLTRLFFTSVSVIFFCLVRNPQYSRKSVLEDDRFLLHVTDRNWAAWQQKGSDIWRQKKNHLLPIRSPVISVP